MSISPSTSYPDLRVHRIKRKPPPPVDLSEDKYPSPDPTDPFAPLWVLRNRTSSALLAPNRDSSYETLTSLARNRPIALPFNSSSTTVVNTSVVSPTLASPTQKIGHYRTRSQTLLMGNAHVFPVLKSPEFTQKDMHYQDVDRSWSIYEQHDRMIRSPLLADSTGDSSGTESDTSLEVQRTIHRSRHSSSHRLTKFLLPKKASPLTSSSDTGHRTQAKHIAKSSISPPMVSNATWEPVVSPVIPHSAIDTYPSMENDINLTPPRAPLLSNSISLDASCGSPRTRVSVGLAIHHDLLDHDYSQHYSSDVQHKKGWNKGTSREESVVPFPAMSPEKVIRRRKIGSMAPSPTTTLHGDTSPSFHISKPVVLASLEQPSPDDAFTCPRPAPRPPTPDMFQHKKLKTSRSACSTPSPLHPPPGEWDLPDARQLTHASSLPIISETGQRITFGSLFATHRTIVIFIRHFWCPLCQDYMSSLKSCVTPQVLRSGQGKGDEEKQLHTELVIVGNGSPVMMAKYRQIFGLPFKMYTDPSNEVYKALGMGKDKTAGHMHCPNPTVRTSGESARLSEKFVELHDRPRKRGGYVRHGMMSGIALVVMRAIKVGMPVWEKGGDIAQLGGEFILGPGQKCSYAHRMQSTKGHAPIRDVLEAAGIFVAAPASTAADGRKSGQDVRPVRLTRKTLSSRDLARPSDSSSSDEDTTVTVISLNSPPLKSSATIQSNNIEMGHESTPPPADTVASDEWKNSSVRIATMTRYEEDNWMERRQRSLERLREKKNIRRGLASRTFVPEPVVSPSRNALEPKASYHRVDADLTATRVVEREQRGDGADVQEVVADLDVALQESIQGSPLMPTAPITGTDDYTVIL
ncbi:hypothetical protein CVT24_000024 [Panaeolus cyanescens]|uniref:Thioredoxin domain-containing protein n=1 Tax=Panaeolus cyanescens TaxID=181874 RepID=A0A409VSK9_9AGAR|nr:hypothetical protein CVT24_000024 [Panaeolus cyanescens]